VLRFIAAVATGVALLGVPASAQASHCADRMVIFSGQAEGPKPNANAACTLVGDAAGDTRLINPGSTEIVVRFTSDFGAAHPTITAVINGLGFSNRTITLTREPGPVSGYVYDSADLALDPSASGCIRANLTAPYGGAAAGSTAFHTFGRTC
jgi:hypothetical protein